MEQRITPEYAARLLQDMAYAISEVSADGEGIAIAFETGEVLFIEAEEGGVIYYVAEN